MGDHAIRLRITHMGTAGAWKIRLAGPSTKIMSDQIRTQELIMYFFK